MPSTLTDFLLARIVEDEEQARIALSGDIDRMPSIRTKSGDQICIGVTHPNRVLRECEAKRRIVEMGTPYTLAWLAHPYSDHPDYRDEWRP